MRSLAAFQSPTEVEIEIQCLTNFDFQEFAAESVFPGDNGGLCGAEAHLAEAS